MPRGIVFDVDGTLVDSVDLHAEAWREALRAFGHDVPFDEVRRQIGKGADQLMPVFLDEDELARRGEELDAFRSSLFKRDYMPRVRAFPQVRELFQAVRGRGSRIVLASSSKADELAEYKRIAGIEDLIDAETSSEDADRSKPHPDIFGAALDRLGLGPGEALAVGDSPWDAEAAARIGLPVVGLLCGGFPEADLRRASCIEIYRDPADLLLRLDESALAR